MQGAKLFYDTGDGHRRRDGLVFSWLDVPTIRASDLSGFNCRPFCMYHCLTSAVQQREQRDPRLCCRRAWTDGAACRRHTGGGRILTPIHQDTVLPDSVTAKRKLATGAKGANQCGRRYTRSVGGGGDLVLAAAAKDCRMT